MNASQIINFDQKVASYVNDNGEFIKEHADASGMSIADAALEHYQLSSEEYESPLLNEEEQARFLENVNYALSNEDGFFLSGGSITSYLKNYDED